MRYMGIDYGTKRVGVALSDEGGSFAMPHGVIQNTKQLIDHLYDIVCEHDVKAIVLGESKDFSGKDNKVMGKIREFKKALEDKVDMAIIFEPEFLTSHQAQSIQGKTELLDASAAALILQSYLDRLQNHPT